MFGRRLEGLFASSSDAVATRLLSILETALRESEGDSGKAFFFQVRWTSPTNGCVRKALEKDDLYRSFSRQSILLQYSEKHAMFLKLPVRYVKEPSSWTRTSSYTSMLKEFASHAREVFTLSLKLWSVRVASTAKDSFLRDARHNMSSPVSGGLSLTCSC